MENIMHWPAFYDDYNHRFYYTENVVRILSFQKLTAYFMGLGFIGQLYHKIVTFMKAVTCDIYDTVGQ